MEFMGIGPLELLVIMVIGLLVFGPHRLPEIAAQIARFMNNMKRAGFELTRELNREIEETKKSVAPVAGEVKAVARTALPVLEEEEAAKETQPPAAVLAAQQPPAALTEDKAEKRGPSISVPTGGL